MKGHLSGCTKYIVIGVITLMVASYSETAFKGADVSAEAKPETTFTSEEQAILTEINDRYYESWRINTSLNDKDELIVNIDHSDMEDAIAESIDETYVTNVMWKLNKNRAITVVERNNEIIDNYTMVCLGEGYAKE